MKFLVLFLSFLTISSSAFALSCMQPDPQHVTESADLIVKARVLNIKKPLIKTTFNQYYDEMIEFKILQIYKVGSLKIEVPPILNVKFPSFMRVWGPDLQEGQEGEYLFQKQGNGWVYAGPGGCSFLEESEWEKLRANAQRDTPIEKSAP